ncbi:MAG: MFS transporter [Anaerolineales bacterium]
MDTKVNSHSLATQLLVTTPVRVLLNTAYRMVYPFLPAFSRGLGVAPEALTQLLAVRNGFGLTGPLFGLVPDRFGRRFAMLLGLAIFTGAFALAAFRPSFATVTIAVFAALIAKALHDPALLAHFGDQTPSGKSGLVIGVSEFGWAGATFIGIPVLGLLIARFGWSAPFASLAILGLLAAFGIQWVIVSTRGAAQSLTPNPSPLGRGGLRALLNPHTLTVLSYGGVVSLGNEMLNVVYGGWMERSFNLRIDQLGLTVAVIGAAELAGEGLVAAFADRVGKRRMVAVATATAAVAYAALPFLSGNLWLALAGVFVVFLGFETGIVANIPLLIDLMPEARSSVVSVSGALNSIGRMVGALLGAWLFGLGFVWVGATAAAVSVVMAALVWWNVKREA